MKKIFAFIFSLLLSVFLSAQEQDSTNKHFSVGIEQDILPYIFNGNFSCFWVGYDHFRLRGIKAKVTKPDFVLAKGFTKNRVDAYAVLIDYFPNTDFSEYWGTVGLVYWDGWIEDKNTNFSKQFDSFLLSFGAGYNWKFYQNFYLSPWAAVHVRVGGPSKVPVGNSVFEPPILNPEGSLKIGWYF